MLYYQLSFSDLFETDPTIPQFGLKEAAYICINNGTKVIIDEIYTKNGGFVYSCHEDTLYQYGHIVKEAELYRYEELKTAKEHWAKMKDQYIHIDAESIKMEETKSYKMVYTKPKLQNGYLGRIHLLQYGVADNRYLYIRKNNQSTIEILDDPWSKYEELISGMNDDMEHAMVFEEEKKVIVPDLFSRDRIVFKDWNSFAFETAC